MSAAALLALALKGAALFAAAAGAAALLRGASSAARRAAWALGFAAVLALPALSALLPRWSAPVLPARAAAADPLPSSSFEPGPPAAAPIPAAGAAPRIAEESTDAAPAPASSALALPPFDLPALLLAVWAAGALAALAWLAAGVLGARSLVLGAAEVRDPAWIAALADAARAAGVRRPVRLVASGRVGVPLTWGTLRPVIVLPAAADAWDAGQRRCVLLHELAHVRRGDWLVQAGAWCACALHWFNPLAWHALRRLRAEIELSADDRVLDAGFEAEDYAAHLLAVARAFRAPRAAAAAAVAMAHPSRLEGRLVAILTPARHRRPPRRRALASGAAAALLLCAPLAALTPVPRAASSPAVAPRTGESALPSAADTLRNVRSWGTVSMGDSPGAATLLGFVPAPGFTCAPVAGPPASGFREQRGTYQVDGAPKRRYVLVYTGPDRCLEADFPEPVAVSDDRRTLVLPPGAEALVREKDASADRVLRLRGSGETEYRVDGAARPYDAATRAWAGALLAEAVDETAAGAPERIRRLLAARGVDAVLAQVRALRSPASRGEHLAALLDARPGDAALALRVVAAARETLAGSQELPPLLAHAATRAGGDESVRRAVWSAAAGLPGYAKADVLAALAASGGFEGRRFALDALGEARSEADRAAFLRRTAPAYLADPALRPAFFAGVESLRSYGARKEVLLALVRGPATPDDVLLSILRSAATMRHDDERADVLVFLAQWRLVRTPALAEGYRAAVGAMRDPGQRERADAALREAAASP